MESDKPVAALIFINWGEYWSGEMVFSITDEKTIDEVLKQFEQQLPYFNDKTLEVSLDKNQYSHKKDYFVRF